MKTKTDILLRIEEIKSNLAIIEENARHEMGKKYVGDMSVRRIHFLFQEKKVWEYALDQLEWILDETPQQHLNRRTLQYGK